jgi:hypothetical protein
LLVLTSTRLFLQPGPHLVVTTPSFLSAADETVIMPLECRNINEFTQRIGNCFPLGVIEECGTFKIEYRYVLLTFTIFYLCGDMKLSFLI